MSFGRPDPIEEFAQKLKSTGSKEDYRLGRKVEAKMRTYAPVVVRGEENQGNCETFGILEDCIYGNIYSCILSNSLSPLSYLWNRNLEIAELW